MLVARSAKIPDEFAAALREWLLRQRWWPGDEGWESATQIELGDDVAIWLLRTPSEVTVQVPLALLPVPDAAPPGVISLASHRPVVRPPGLIAEVRVDGRDRFLVDAAHDDRFHRALLTQSRIVEPWLRRESGGMLVPEPEDERPGAGGVEADEDDSQSLGAVLAVEQSNTSIIMPRVHHGVIVKLLRCVVDGNQPDLDVPNALASAGFAHVPRTYAVLEAVVDDGRFLAGWQATLGIVSQLVADAEDGFTRACAMAASDLPFTADLAALGADLADMHVALRRAFPAETRSIHEVLAAIGARIEDSAERSEAVADLLGPIDTYLAALRRQLPDSPVTVQRLHSDLHLGQTLWSPHGWWILDFEGEPLRPLADRITPDLPERDLAGMLRSIDYAAALTDAGEAWRVDARDALLTGYYSHLGPVDERTPHIGDEARRSLLDAFELDRAAYEVGYEHRHRQQWEWVPTDALMRILGRFL
ncbi:hypothetical protein GCM10010401_00390 [Rarobacter faecitabidus]|uniref:Putative trehalose synthase n=1 Tax=Rarobacter faecitabidus TaxID=13243 RepID=A0A542ZX86_RARFA|nr:hypothetical protein [Rarobacter faecitabidus]TQL64820.1 putative trehalose synthase [Rarobacter faecitabidus]